MKQDMIVILDLGSTENTVLARNIRDLGVYREIHPHDITVEELENLDPSNITILDIRSEEDFRRGSFPGAINIGSVVAVLVQDFDGFLALLSGVAENIDRFVCRKVFFQCFDGTRLKKAFLRAVLVQIFFHGNIDGSWKRTPAEILL